MAEGDTLVNALVGALVTIFTTPVLPFAPIIGGVVCGYLQGTDTEDGLKVGALSGLIAIVPLLLVFFLLGNLFLVLFALTGESVVALLGGIGALLAVLFLLSVLVYVVLLSALGGWVGSYLKAESRD